MVCLKFKSMEIPEDPEAVALPGDAGVLRYDESQGLGAPPATKD